MKPYHSFHYPIACWGVIAGISLLLACIHTWNLPILRAFQTHHALEKEPAYSMMLCHHSGLSYNAIILQKDICCSNGTEKPGLILDQWFLLQSLHCFILCEIVSNVLLQVDRSPSYSEPESQVFV